MVLPFLWPCYFLRSNVEREAVFYIIGQVLALLFTTNILFFFFLVSKLPAGCINDRLSSLAYTVVSAHRFPLIILCRQVCLVAAWILFAFFLFISIAGTYLLTLLSVAEIYLSSLLFMKICTIFKICISLFSLVICCTSAEGSIKDNPKNGIKRMVCMVCSRRAMPTYYT